MESFAYLQNYEIILHNVKLTPENSVSETYSSTQQHFLTSALLANRA